MIRNPVSNKELPGLEGDFDGALWEDSSQACLE